MNNKILITGFSGFVARHFIKYLYENHPEFEVYGISRNCPNYHFEQYSDKLKIKFYQIDLMDYENLHKALEEIVPDYILHLASLSSVAYSWKFPEESFTNNSNIFLNLIESIRDVNLDCRILSVGSSEEYGNVPHSELPIRESQPLDPLSPYAAARVSQELLSRIYSKAYGMKIIMTRSFNHIGPGQDERFVIPSFIHRILDIKTSGQKSGEIETGNLNIIRDFIDVRDVVIAYYELLMHGTIGETYNVCSGKGIKLSEMIALISKEIGVDVSTRVNPSFVRPNDNLEIVGTPYKIHTELNWEPTIELGETLKDMIEYISSK